MIMFNPFSSSSKGSGLGAAQHAITYITAQTAQSIDDELMDQGRPGAFSLDQVESLVSVPIQDPRGLMAFIGNAIVDGASRIIRG